jgi:peptidoglycan/xylan/chitin deacetylase (PgdA/CDA1 family)
VLASKSKRLLKKALIGSSVLPVASRFFPPTAAILAYHSIAENPQQTDHILGVSRGRDEFERHMKTLAQKFHPVTIEAVANFAQGKGKLPPRAVAVTFDDGFADNYEVALPILQRYGIPASFYIMVEAVEHGTLPWYCRLRYAFNVAKVSAWQDPNSGRTYRLDVLDERKAAQSLSWDTGARLTGAAQQAYVGQCEQDLEVEPVKAPHGFMMTWDQVRGLRKAGHIVGGHTLWHPNVAQVTPPEARSEIMECKKRLEEKMGEPVVHFSYPHPALNPHWSNHTLELTKEAGFKSAALTTYGPVRKGDDSHALKRLYTPADIDQFTLNLQTAFLKRAG